MMTDDPQLELIIHTYEKEEKQVDVDTIVKLIHQTLKRIRNRRWSISKPTEWWKMTLDLTPFEKKWCPNETNRVGVCHVNGGWTQIHTDPKKLVEIEIWRAEDWLKVVEHELNHAHRLDRLVEGEEAPRFPSPAEEEAFVEALARIEYCRNQFPVSDRSRVLDQELKWSRQLSNKMRHAPQWTSDTNTFAYYVLTFALFSQWKRLLSWFFRSTTVKQMQTEWPRLRDECWTACYGSSFLWRQPSSETSECLSLSMISPSHQIFPTKRRRAGNGGIRHGKKNNALTIKRPSDRLFLSRFSFR
jgi:hypothetical protein